MQATFHDPTQMIFPLEHIRQHHRPETSVSLLIVSTWRQRLHFLSEFLSASVTVGTGMCPPPALWNTCRVRITTLTPHLHHEVCVCHRCISHVTVHSKHTKCLKILRQFSHDLPRLACCTRSALNLHQKSGPRHTQKIIIYLFLCCCSTFGTSLQPSPQLFILINCIFYFVSINSFIF